MEDVCGGWAGVAAVAGEAVEVQRREAAGRWGVVERIAYDGDFWAAVSENAAAPNSGLHCWTVEVINTKDGDMLAGVCTAEADPVSTPDLGFSDCAKCFYLYNGGFCGQLPGAETSAKDSGLTEAFKNGDKLRLELDTDKGTLVAYKNGTRLPGHITGLAGRELHAFVGLYNKGDKLRVAAGQ